MIPADIETRLMTELELWHVFSESDRQKILEKSLKLLNLIITEKALDQLSEQDSDDFERFLDSEGATPKGMFSFLATRLPKMNVIVEESLQETVQEIKPVLERQQREWLERAVDIHMEIRRESERRELKRRRIIKIASWVTGSLVSLLVGLALVKLGIIPMDWVIPKWVQRIF